VYVKLKSETRSRTHCCRGKEICITYSEPVSITLVIQHTKRMRLIMSSVTCPAVTTFFHIISYTTRLSGKKYILNVKRVF